MNPGRAGWLSRFLVGLHPRRWRQRYAEEVLAVLDQYQPTARTVLNIGVSVVSTHLDPAWHGWPSLRARLRWFNTWDGRILTGLVVTLLIVAGGCTGVGMWQEQEGNNGPPMPLSDGVSGITFSPDGRVVAAINSNLQIWSVADPAHPVRLGYSKRDTVGAPAAFSPDGQILATSGQPGRLWNVAHPTPRPAQLGLLPDYPDYLNYYVGGMNALLFFPDGRTLVGADAMGMLTVWDTADPMHPTHLATLAGSGTSATAGQAVGVSSLAYSPGAPILASGDASGNVTLWNASDPAHLTRLTTVSGAGLGGVSALAYSPDGHLLASASDTGTVVLRDVTNPAAPVITAVIRLPRPRPAPGSIAVPSNVEIAFSAGGHTLTDVADTTVTQWDVANPAAVTRIATFTSDRIGAGGVAFGPGGRLVAGAPTSGDTLALWTLP